MEVRTRAVTPTDADAIQSLFGAQGACGGCWCMLWRVPSLGRAWERNKGQPNRAEFLALLGSGQISGVLAWVNDEPVGWCSAAPQDDFPYLARSKLLALAPDPRAWAVSCFYIARGWRGQGIATRLLAEAEQVASSGGATRMLGFPVAADRRAPDVFVHTGVLSLFADSGYRTLRRAGARVIVQKALNVRPTWCVEPDAVPH